MLRIAANELRSLARDGAFRAVVAGYLFALLAASLVHMAGFLSAGESQVALMGDLLLHRITGVQLIFLAALTPWIVFRLRDGDSTWGLVPEPAAMAVAPWQTVLSTLAALAACLFALLSASLPVLSMIRLFGAATYREIAWSLADALLLLLVLVVLVLGLRLNSRSRAASWAFSYVALGAVAAGWHEVSSSMDHASSSLLLLLSFSFLALLLLVSANWSLRYPRTGR
jgi:hypothetical protein